MEVRCEFFKKCKSLACFHYKKHTRTESCISNFCFVLLKSCGCSENSEVLTNCNTCDFFGIENYACAKGHGGMYQEIDTRNVFVLKKCKEKTTKKYNEKEILDIVLDQHDGPVTVFVALYRALHLAKSGNVSQVANALYEALEILKKGDLPSKEE